jgi:hypothetical protein
MKPSQPLHEPVTPAPLPIGTATLQIAPDSGRAEGVADETPRPDPWGNSSPAAGPSGGP